jgi:hypothetical protein
MEYVYRLNLPGFNEILNPNFSLSDCFGNEYIKSPPVTEWLRPEWHNFKNLDWTTRNVLLRFAPGTSNQIHVDNPTLEDTRCWWGINWIIGNGGTNFWTRDQISSSEIITDTSGYKRPKLTMSGPPIKNYKTVHNGVYLIYAYEPHSAYNDIDATSDRIAICTRPDFLSPLTPKTWGEVIELFKDLIIEY